MKQPKFSVRIYVLQLSLQFSRARFNEPNKFFFFSFFLSLFRINERTINDHFILTSSQLEKSYLSIVPRVQSARSIFRYKQCSKYIFQYRDRCSKSYFNTILKNLISRRTFCSTNLIISFSNNSNNF